MKMHKLAVLIGIKSVEQIGVDGNHFDIEFHANMSGKGVKFNEIFERFFFKVNYDFFANKGKYQIPKETLAEEQEAFLAECQEVLGLRVAAQKRIQKTGWSPATFSPETGKRPRDETEEARSTRVKLF